jgi:GT2 family glycosyltransferase
VPLELSSIRGVTAQSFVIDVTVSIVHASKPELTLECLESLHQDRDRRCSVEIVVLDNDADDDLPRSVARRFNSVRVIEQAWRTGFGANHNTVIRATESLYVFVLNPDTSVPVGTIDRLVEYLETHPTVAVVGPLIRGFDGVQQGSAWRLMTIPVQLLWALSLGRFGAVVSRGTAPRRVGAVSGSAMLVRRRAFEDAGFFDDAYFMFGEEADLGQRLRRLGLETHYLPSAEVLHHGQQSTTHVPERQINEVWRSMDVYLARYHSPFQACILRWLTGLGYGLAFVAAEVGKRLPRPLRPLAASTWNPNAYAFQVRNAFRAIRDPGMRELSEEWNRTRRAVAAMRPHEEEPAPRAQDPASKRRGKGRH